MPRVSFFKLTLKLYKIYRPFLNPILLPRFALYQYISCDLVVTCSKEETEREKEFGISSQFYNTLWRERERERESGGGGGGGEREKERERTWGRSELVREYWPYVWTHFATSNPKFQRRISDIFTGWSSVLAEECVIRSRSWYHTEVLSQRSPREASWIMLCALSIRIYRGESESLERPPTAWNKTQRCVPMTFAGKTCILEYGVSLLCKH